MGPRRRRGFVAGGGGFEPPLRGPEPRVLPLDDPPPATNASEAYHTAESRGDPQRMATLRLRLGRKRGTRADGIVISLPVRGSRPLRAARFVTTKVPNPEIVTRRPRRSDSTIPLTMALTAFSAEVFEPPPVFAMMATRSALVTPPSYSREVDGVNDVVTRRTTSRKSAGWNGFSITGTPASSRKLHAPRFAVSPVMKRKRGRSVASRATALR